MKTSVGKELIVAPQRLMIGNLSSLQRRCVPLLPAPLPPSLVGGPTFSLFPPATGHSRARAPLTCLKVTGRAKRSAEAVASGRGEGLEVVEGRRECNIATASRRDRARNESR